MTNPSVALVVVDVQVDFCPGGVLAVPQGTRVIEPINRLLHIATQNHRPVIATRDWHPRQSSHFTSGGGRWPPHGVADSKGAAFHPDLLLPAHTIIVSKGLQPDENGYSAFDGVDDKQATLLTVLNAHAIKDVLVCGLATDYCVLATVLDAMRSGFSAFVVLDAIAPVNLNDTDGEEAAREMQDAGAHMMDTAAAQSFLLRDNGNHRRL
ncbi:MAG: isochorismatase family protein [Planctomycetaceae bacterium]